VDYSGEGQGLVASALVPCQHPRYQIETMRKLFAKEVELDAPAKAEKDIPLTYEHITNEYLAAVIAKKVPGA
jgi:hypothetical protein